MVYDPAAVLAEEQVLGIAMAWRGERGMSGLRSLDPQDFIQRPVHGTIARNILDLADRRYQHNANAVSKLTAIRQQPVPWDYHGPLQRTSSGQTVQPPTSGYLRQLQENSQPYETSLHYAVQVRESFRKDYLVSTGHGFQRLGDELTKALTGKEDQWEVTARLTDLRQKVLDRIDGCPPSLVPLLTTSVGHDQLQKTLTAVSSRTSQKKVSAGRDTR